jgi:hypothetical protein
MLKILRGVALIAASMLSLTACTMRPANWNSYDWRYVGANSGAAQPLELAVTECRGDAARSKAVAPSRNDIAESAMAACMASKSYVWAG